MSIYSNSYLATRLRGIKQSLKPQDDLVCFIPQSLGAKYKSEYIEIGLL